MHGFCGAEAASLQSKYPLWAKSGLLRLEGVRVAWFLQAVLHVGALSIFLLTLRRVFASGWAVGLAFALAALAPRVFFTTCIWNQDEYVFFFATFCTYAAVAAAAAGLDAYRILLAAVAVALGFAVKLTISIPAAAMLGFFMLLPEERAPRVRKVAVVALVALLVFVVNFQLFTTPEGRERLTWHRMSQYWKDRHNGDDIVGAYLTLNPGPFLRPEPIYVPQSPSDWTGRNSFTTSMVLHLFELNAHFQGPPRNWLNLLCVWTGLPLLGVVLWRMARTAVDFARRRIVASADVYCATLVFLSGAALLYMSLRFPFGWSPHVEYVIAAYPAAAILLVRQIWATDSPPVRAALTATSVAHVAANLAMIVHAADYKIALSM
jgi:4-amino-4-deoxy-L-arabinose transferase-like glycosyltransferase